MCGIGGFMGAYAVLCRGVLGSAQTLNMMEIVFAVFGRDFHALLLRVIGFALYILGIALVDVIARKTRINLRRYSILINMAGFLILAFIPASVDPVAGVLPAFFMLSTQWSVFHGVRGYNSATVFSTNNLRQAVVSLSGYAFTKDRKLLRDALYYLNTLLWFYSSAAISYAAVKSFGL